MATKIKTKFAGKKNPFTGEPTMKRVDADQISITNDPLPKRKTTGSKYDALFSSLKPGQCLRVPTGAVNSVAQGMRKWLMKNNQNPGGRVKAALNYCNDAGFGRVWLLKGGAA